MKNFAFSLYIRGGGGPFSGHGTYIKSKSSISQTTLFVCLWNVTFNNISVISQWSLLLLEVARVPGENHQP